jgi:bifunctional non-homologous end joining protein LigD
LIYYVFDLLHLDGRDLSTLPLEERKQELRKLIPRETTKSRVRFSDHVVGHGKQAYSSACRAHLEGIICKLRDAPYRPGRGGEWVKCKCQQEQEFVIGGYSEPQGTRSGFGSLLLGYYDRRHGLKYAGRVGTGFSDITLKQLTPKLKRLGQSASPFDGEPRPDRLRGVHWVKPTLVAQVHFAQWTDDGLLRQPSFQGLREDKPAKNVVRERAVARPRRRQVEA